MKWGLSNTEFQYEKFFHIQFISNSFIQYLGELTVERTGGTTLHLTGSPVLSISSSGLKKLSSILPGHQELLVYPISQKWTCDSPCSYSFSY